MSEHETAPDGRASRGPIEGVLRLDLLGHRFSQQEVQRLCALQLRQGTRPDALDRSVQEERLQFARWLVQHGRLDEGADDTATSLREAPVSGTQRPTQRPRQGCPSVSDVETTGAFAGAAPGEPTCDPSLDATVQQRNDRRCPLQCVWAWIRQGFVRAAGIGSRLGSWAFIPTEPAEIDPFSLHDPHGGPWRYIDDPWPWTHFHSGW